MMVLRSGLTRLRLFCMSFVLPLYLKSTRVCAKEWQQKVEILIKLDAKYDAPVNKIDFAKAQFCNASEWSPRKKIRGQSTDVQKVANHMLSGILIASLCICITFFLDVLDAETVFAMITLNTVFLSFIFPLQGSLGKKILILSAANTSSAMLNVALSMLFSHQVSGTSYRFLYVVADSFLNLVLIVTSYSVGLTILARKEESPENVPSDHCDVLRL